MFCPQCGKPLAEGARFCGSCGTAIAAAPSASAPAPGNAIDAGSAVPLPPGSQTPPPAPGQGLGADGAPPPGTGTPPPSGTGGLPPHGTFPPYGGVPPPGSPGATRTSGLVERVKRILMSPNAEWPVIAAEPTSERDIYLGYVAPLAAIGAIASFIGTTAVGVSVPLLGTVRTPIVPALIGAVLHYGLTFLVVFVVSLIINALAPTFDGQKDRVRALKLTAYSFTASWVAAVVTVIPMLGIIAFLAGLYGLYLLYLGLPVLMRNPPQKSVGYTIVVVICAIVLMFVIGMVTAGLMGAFGGGVLGTMSHGGAATQQQRDTDVAAGVVSKMLGGESAADQARMKEAIATLSKMGEQAEASQKGARASGGDAGAGGANAVDVNAALAAVGTMMAGGKEVQPVDFHVLQDLLPASLPGMQRTEASGQSGEAMGMKGSSATGHYGNGGPSGITIEIADLGSLQGLASLAARFDPKMEKETATGYERTRTVSGQLVHERYDRQAKSGETNVMVGNRFSVTVRGHGVDASQLTGALQAIDMARLPKVAAAK